MPGKTRKHPSKLDQILGGLNRLNKRVAGLAQNLESLRQETAQEFKAVRQETAQQFEAMEQRTAQRFETMEQQTAQRFEAMQQETKKEFEHQRNAFQKQINWLAQRMDVTEQVNAKFRSDMYSGMDSMTKDYETFQHEKAALGAGQDRLEKEIEEIKKSDKMHEQTIHELDVRVTQLESQPA